MIALRRFDLNEASEILQCFCSAMRLLNCEFTFFHFSLMLPCTIQRPKSDVPEIGLQDHFCILYLNNRKWNTLQMWLSTLSRYPR